MKCMKNDHICKVPRGGYLSDFVFHNIIANIKYTVYHPYQDPFPSIKRNI